jgi:hypothetical protein
MRRRGSFAAVRKFASMRTLSPGPWLLLALVGCSASRVRSVEGTSSGGGSPVPDDAAAPSLSTSAARLEIAPDNALLLIDRGQSATRAFTVTLVRADGTRMEVTTQAKLSADNGMAGTLEGALFESAVMPANTVAFTRVDAMLENGGSTLRARA